MSENFALSTMPMVTGNFVSSIPMTGTNEQKALLYKATNKPDFKIGETQIGKTIMAKDLYIEIMDDIDEVTEEVIGQYPNMIIIDQDGLTYQSSSRGIYSSLKRICNIFGAPTWKDPIPMTFKSEKMPNGKQGYYHTIEVNFPAAEADQEI